MILNTLGNRFFGFNRSKIQVFLWVTFLFCLISTLPQDLLMYDRVQILNGEVYRLVSAHFVHAGPTHMLLNVLALISVILLWPGHYSLRENLFIVFFLISFIDVGLFFLFSEVHWYYGSSGLLYALAGFAILEFEKRSKRYWIFLGLAAFALFSVKSEDHLEGLNILGQAHFLGVLGALVLNLLIKRRLL